MSRCRRDRAGELHGRRLSGAPGPYKANPPRRRHRSVTAVQLRPQVNPSSDLFLHSPSWSALSVTRPALPNLVQLSKTGCCLFLLFSGCSLPAQAKQPELPTVNLTFPGPLGIIFMCSTSSCIFGQKQSREHAKSSTCTVREIVLGTCPGTGDLFYPPSRHPIRVVSSFLKFGTQVKHGQEPGNASLALHGFDPFGRQEFVSASRYVQPFTTVNNQWIYVPTQGICCLWSPRVQGATT